MGIRADIQYIGYRILRECGLGTYVPAQVAAGATQMRVINAEMFEPAGGQCIIEATDNLVTYTAVQDDLLTGIPASGTGSIGATVEAYTADTPSLIYLPELLTTDELEGFIDRYRDWMVLPVYPSDALKKKYRVTRGWLGEDWELRDSRGSSYNAVTPDDDDNETGEFSFNSGQNYSVLYAAAWYYNPWLSIADIVESLIRIDRWSSYSAVGQLIRRQSDPAELAAVYRKRGSMLSFLAAP